VVVFNRAAEVLFGCAAKAAIGQHLNSFIPQRLRTAHAGYMQDYRERGTSARSMGKAGRVLALHADGSEIPVEASISRVTAQGRQLYSVVLRDIRSRLEAEAARFALESQLRESQKMEAIGTLAGGIAHDFNNVLGAILGNVSLAKKDVEAGNMARAKVSLEEIGKAGARAAKLVQQILAFSRREPHEMVVQALGPLVEETLRLLRATLPAGVELKASLGERALYVRANATQIGQVLMNLCTNAWHALGESGGRIEVVLDAVRFEGGGVGSPVGLAGGEYARLRVMDNGSGMDEATRARIFEPFFTTKAVDKGTGLGLAVVHGIVKAHRGAITVSSVVGEGSTFEVLLRLEEAPEDAVAEDGHAQASEDGHGKHVLYVDDDEAMGFLVKRMLEDHGYRVSCHERAQDALEVVRMTKPGSKDDFDLVVTDFNMPGASGLEVARELARMRPGLPVVIISGYIDDELEAGAREAGVRDLIYKPNTVDRLCRSVEFLLERGRAEKK